MIWTRYSTSKTLHTALCKLERIVVKSLYFDVHCQRFTAKQMYWPNMKKLPGITLLSGPQTVTKDWVRERSIVFFVALMVKIAYMPVSNAILLYNILLYILKLLFRASQMNRTKKWVKGRFNIILALKITT